MLGLIKVIDVMDVDVLFTPVVIIIGHLGIFIKVIDII